MTQAVVEAVEAANAEFYAAFEEGDLDRMAAVWDDGAVSCVHPGWPMLRGRDRVLRSWVVIMANTTYIQFVLTDVQVSLHGDVAVVSCDENILTGAEDIGRTGRVTATNVFRRRGDRWRLLVHHASPVMSTNRGPAE
jgi:uncharacterized protein (TIGR02246 family)